MLVDEITIRFVAGHGGRGAVAFNKIRLAQGPTGGDGGTGGSIYLEGVSDIGALQLYANKKEIQAEDGKNGRGQFIDGRKGEDLILKVPIGTTVTNLETGYAQEIQKVSERILVAGGGSGGKGNFKFRSSTNTSPKEYQAGFSGDTSTYKLELRLIADVGLVGLPNAGKSSLLNELTGAKSKVANYAFTTLEAHLGAYYELIIADIPGLIEGAHLGRGLGVKFLKHVERTKILFHLISAESTDLARDYDIVRTELEKYNPALLRKEEYVILTKIDILSPKEVEEKLSVLKKRIANSIAVSILDVESMDRLKKILNDIKSKKLTGV
ncbi:MAG TPA: GTPase ObgE [Candidatus Paceibacterota bacterium]